MTIIIGSRAYVLEYGELEVVRTRIVGSCVSRLKFPLLECAVLLPEYGMIRVFLIHGAVV